MISIHALRTEGDPSGPAVCCRFRLFLSTPSVRRATDFFQGCVTVGLFLSTPSVQRATKVAVKAAHGKEISIHTLRTEGDATQVEIVPGVADFYPHPPYGGRPPASWESFHQRHFYPRPLVCRKRPPAIYFYPRPPYGGRHWHRAHSRAVVGVFLSTPSVRRAT